MQRLLLTVTGSVQGVGFRPFIYRLAHTHSLLGSVQNTTRGVQIDVQGKEDALVQFQKDIIQLKPERSSIFNITTSNVEPHQIHSFTIIESEKTKERELALLPDTAICPSCLMEFNDPTNRRYRYPFIHCTSCGPRFSLFTDMPFDRKNTTMIDFPMCEECQKEYNNPHDRRFYSQTTCCPTCGPKLTFFAPTRQIIGTQEEAISHAIDLLQQGMSLAVKNTGGFLLLADATNEDTVRRLRSLKKRPHKPFAMMVPSLEAGKEIADIFPLEEEILSSPASPIVLARKKNTKLIANSVAEESPYYGIMLPHSALHHLILKALNRPLIATSGNISGAPIAITEEEAFSSLSEHVDGFLVHTRRIIHRVDDSIVQVIKNKPTILRRARGYIPHAICLPTNMNMTQELFATGGHLKNSFAFGKKNKIYLSQHIGDLDSAQAIRSYHQEIEGWTNLLAHKPSSHIHDLHPAYYTTTYVAGKQVEKRSIQHHKAHIYSCMLDNLLSPPLLGISWDGSGYGEDHTVWGGESFLVLENKIERCASLFSFCLPGGEKAIREPRRSLLGMFYAMNLPPSCQGWITSHFSNEEQEVLLQALQKKIHSPTCSSIGRLFDGISALLGCTTISSFEGQAALSLENLALKSSSKNAYHIPFKNGLLDWRDMVYKIVEDIKQKKPREDIALAFHLALAESILAIAKTFNQQKVLLTGGVMQNRVLLENAIEKLKNANFHPYWHQNIPPNDGGLAAGQLFGTMSCV